MEGKSSGERGKVIAVDRKRNTILVDQVNLVCGTIFTSGGTGMLMYRWVDE